MPNGQWLMDLMDTNGQWLMDLMNTMDTMDYGQRQWSIVDGVHGVH